MGFEVFNQQIFNAYIYRYRIELFTGSFNIYLDLINEYNDTTISSIPTVGSNVLFNLYGFNIPGTVTEVNQATIYIQNNNSTRINFEDVVNFNKNFKTPKIAYSVKIQSAQMLMKNFFSATLNSTLNLAVFSDSVDLSYRNWFINCIYNISELNSFPTNLSLNFDANNYINNLIINDKRLSDSGDNTIFIADSSLSRSKIEFLTEAFPSQTSTTTTTTTSATPSSSTTIPVYPIKYFGCYLSHFNGYLAPNEDGKLWMYLYDDPSTNSVFQPPIINSDFTFNFDGLRFKGIVSRYEQQDNPLSSCIKKYFVEVLCYEGVSNFSDTIFNQTVASFSFSVDASTVRLDSGQSDIKILSYLITSSNPSTEYGSYFAWNSPNDFNLASIKYTASRTWPPTSYEISGTKTISLTQTTVRCQTSPPSNPAASSSATTTTTSGGTQTTSSFNSFGVGNSTQVEPNSSNEPIGTTTTVSTTDDGLTIQVTKNVTASTITTTTTQSFNSYIDTSTPMASQRRELMGVPKDFKGSIDPTLIFPSVEVYPSGSYKSKESGRYFGKCASPTSYDLDPYFYFTTNDFYFVAKDNLTNTKDINIQKDGIKDHVRTMGLRGPMYLSGWGYDVRGLPIPNASGTTIETGTLNGKPQYGVDPSGNYKFHPETSTNRGKWKTGPIDLRWHDKRKVWVGGQEMLEGYLLENLSAPSTPSGSTVAKMSVLRIAASDGLENKISENITITNRDSSLSAVSGAYCIVVDINYEWRPIYIGC